jgi:hypothetical protein
MEIQTSFRTTRLSMGTYSRSYCSLYFGFDHRQPSQSPLLFRHSLLPDFPASTLLVPTIRLFYFDSLMASDEALPFLHSRNRLTQAEILLHKNSIESLEKDIINVEKEISRLQTQLRYLQHKKADHASCISPLRRFPPEILREIVYTCLYNGVQLTTLTQICGAFRDVVVGMSDLWNRISLVSPVPRTRTYTIPYPLVSISLLF